MSTSIISHELRCPAERFWEMFLDSAFMSKVYREGLGFPEWTVREERDAGGEHVRVVRVAPKLDVPGPIAKLLGASFSYIEDGRFDRATSIYRFKVTPSTLADKVRNEGAIRCESAGDGRCLRIVDVTIEAKIFGLGGLFESSVEKMYRVGWQKSAEYMNAWVDAHPQA